MNDFDQYYTQDTCAEECVEVYRKVLENVLSVDFSSNTIVFVEPSAGEGAFLRALGNNRYTRNIPCKGFDIDPKREDIIRSDFLSDNILDKDRALQGKELFFIGNPPFGYKGKMAYKFINKCFDYSHTVGFILPVQFRKYGVQKHINSQASLISDILLPEESFIYNDKPYSLRCCFQVWTIRDVDSSIDLREKQAPKTSHPDFDMFLYNCTKETEKFFDYDFDFAVYRQGWGSFSPILASKCDNGKALSRKKQWLFFKAHSKRVLDNLLSIDWDGLANKNTTSIRGFGKRDVVEEYTRLFC